MGINEKFNWIKTKMGIVIFSIGKPGEQKLVVS